MSRSTWQAGCFVAGLALTLGALPLAANDTIVGSVGGKWQPLNSEHIRMVSENIKVRLGKRRAHVTCEFVFKNEGPAQKVKVGFPQELGTAPLHGFRCWVDGAEVQVESRVTKVSQERLDRDPTLGHHPYEGWHWWWMSFEPEQVRRVSHTYEANYSMAAWSPRTIDYVFSYILRTGANWKGAIGEARVEVDLGVALGAEILTVTPSGYEVEGNRITWLWQDFEPEENIRVQWVRNPYVTFRVELDPEGRRRGFLQLLARDCKRADVIFVPLRWLASQAGAECRWDPGAQTVTIVPESGRELRLMLGSAVAHSDWGAISLGGEVERLYGRLVAPVRPVAEWLGLSVDFEIRDSYQVLMH